MELPKSYVAQKLSAEELKGELGKYEEDDDSDGGWSNNEKSPDREGDSWPSRLNKYNQEGGKEEDDDSVVGYFIDY